MNPVNEFVKVIVGNQIVERAPMAAAALSPSPKLSKLMGKIAKCALEAETDAKRKQHLKIEIVELTAKIEALEESKAEAQNALNAMREQTNM